MKKNKTAVAVAAIVGLVVLIGVLYGVYRYFAPSAVAGEKHINITIQFPDEEKQYELDTDAEYLREALASVAEIGGEESEEYGFTLYTIDGVTADFATGNAYWAIYVDGEYGMLSLDRQPVTDGGSYAIVYETYEG